MFQQNQFKTEITEDYFVMIQKQKCSPYSYLLKQYNSSLLCYVIVDYKRPTDQIFHFFFNLKRRYIVPFTPKRLYIEIKHQCTLKVRASMMFADGYFLT